MILSSPFSFKISSWHNHSIAQLKVQKQTPKKHNTRRYQRSVLPTGDTMMHKTLWCRLPPPWTSSGTGPCCGGTSHFSSLLWMLLSGQVSSYLTHSLLLIVGPVAITSRMARPSYSSSDLVECSSVEPTSICKYPVTRKNISFAVLGGAEKIRKTKNQIVEH
jgi:hypothetical protein